eukprot:g59453.t1
MFSICRSFTNFSLIFAIGKPRGGIVDMSDGLSSVNFIASSDSVGRTLMSSGDSPACILSVSSSGTII